MTEPTKTGERAPKFPMSIKRATDALRRMFPLAGKPHVYSPKWSDIENSICQCGSARTWCKGAKSDDTR